MPEWHKRFGVVSVSDLKDQAATIESLGTDIQNIGREMKRMRQKDLVLDGLRKAGRGIEALDLYLRQVFKSIGSDYDVLIDSRAEMPLRRGPVTADQIIVIASDLGERVRSLREAADEASRQGLINFEIDGHRKFAHANRELTRYYGHLSSALVSLD